MSIAYRPSRAQHRATIAKVYRTEGTRLARLSVKRSKRALALHGLGCAGSCGCSKCSGGLGSSPLTSSGTTTATGTIVAAGVSIAAGAEAGAAAGSVVPGIGNVVGAVVGAIAGLLTKKLFGNANYGQIYSIFQNQMTLLNAYMQVAGTYPGRLYGWCEMRNIWAAAMGYGLFPGNGPPTPGSCTQALIASNVDACGNGQWLNDWLGSTVCGSEASNSDCSNNTAAVCNPGPGTAGAVNNILNLVATALSKGYANPIDMVSEVVSPGAEVVAEGKNNAWISVKNSVNPSLYTQMLVDTADILASNANPSMQIYYGSSPSTAASPAAAAAPAASPAPAAAASYAAPGTQITPQDGTDLVTPQGTFSFETSLGSSTAGDYDILVDGAPAGGAAGSVLEYTGSETLYATTTGAVYAYNGGSGWGLVQAAAAAPASVASVPAASASQTCTSYDSDGTQITVPCAQGSAVTTSAVPTTTAVTPAASAAPVTIPAGYYEVGTDYATGDAVYEDPTGVLYLWNGTSMTAFTGNLSSGTAATVLQAQLQSDIASGQTQAQALANALAAIAAQGVEVTPEVQQAVAQQVATTAAAPATVAGVTLSTNTLLIGGGILAASLIMIALFSGRRNG